MRLLAVIRKEFCQLRRDPKTLLMVILMPPLVMILFGLGYGGKPGKLDIAVCIEDRESPLGWKLVRMLENQGTVKAVYYVATPEEGIRLLERGKVFALLIIPRGFGEEVLKGGQAEIELVVDETMPKIAELLYQATAALIHRFQEQMAERYALFSINVIRRTVYGPKVNAVESFLPLIAGVLLHLVPMSLMAISISRERERGTFELLVMTPITRWELIFGKVLAYFIAITGDLMLTLLLAVALFDVRLRGSLADLLLLSALFLLCSLAVGILISVLSKNQLQAQEAATFFFIPSLLFSGAFTPLEMLAPAAQILARALPMPYFVDGFRAIIIRGYTLAEVAHDLAALSVFTVISFVLAILMLKLSLE